jgi:hypothetical protein
MPMVGWKRAPLSAVSPISEVFLISVLLILHIEIHMLAYMLINCELVNNYSRRMLCSVLISNVRYMFIIERPCMAYDNK